MKMDPINNCGVATGPDPGLPGRLDELQLQRERRLGDARAARRRPPHDLLGALVVHDEPDPRGPAARTAPGGRGAHDDDVRLVAGAQAVGRTDLEAVLGRTGPQELQLPAVVGAGVLAGVAAAAAPADDEGAGAAEPARKVRGVEGMGEACGLHRSPRARGVPVPSEARSDGSPVARHQESGAEGSEPSAARGAREAAGSVLSTEAASQVPPRSQELPLETVAEPSATARGVGHGQVRRSARPCRRRRRRRSRCPRWPRSCCGSRRGRRCCRCR